MQERCSTAAILLGNMRVGKLTPMTIEQERSGDSGFVQDPGLCCWQNLFISFQEDTMRSNLVFGATAYVSNRYLLTMLASKATRKLHRPNTRIQETTNEVLLRFSRVSPIASALLTKIPIAAPLRRASLGSATPPKASVTQSTSTTERTTNLRITIGPILRF